MAIACVYCGGAHDGPADVRACWQRQQSGVATPPPPPAEQTAGAPAITPTPASITRIDVERAAGPDLLGRHLVVARLDRPIPAPWSDSPIVPVDGDSLADPTPLLAVLRAAAIERQRLVIVCAVDDGTLRDAHDERPPYELGPHFSFPLDEIHHLVFANAVDARNVSAPRWPLLDAAVSLGARPANDGSADVLLPDGTAAWLDGGQVRFHRPIDGVAVLPAMTVEHGSLQPPRANECTAALAPDQLEAVTHPGGSARIIAPAGSGKTRVLTERARHLLTGWALPSGAVSLVAFNKRAQGEMVDRTRDLPGLQVRTLNSIALAIVNGVAPFAPQPTSWRTLAEPEVRGILGKLVQFPRKRNADPIAPWIEALSAIRLGLRDPARVEAEYDGDVAGLADVWPRFRAALARDGAVDFDDQIYRALDVLVSQPAARYAAQRASRMLLVDEFQDLTPAHLLLVRLLSAPAGNVFGVGDDDQTIYGYNGADPAWLIDFASLFPGSGDHPLTVNYRCPAGVVASADRLLRHNRRRVPKVIHAASSDLTDVEVRNDEDSVQATLDAVTAALAGGMSVGDIAVLSRVNSLLAPIQAALAGSSVPISGGVGLEFMSRTAVRAVLAWLRLSTGRSTRGFAVDDVREALRRPSRPLHPRIADWVAEQTDIDGLERLAARLTNDRDSQRVAEFAGDVARLQRLGDHDADTERLVRTLVEDIGLGGSVATLDAKRHGMNRAAQGDDLLALAQLARLQPDPARFERWLSDQLTVSRSDSGVVLATVHRVKGQEWPMVVIHAAGADQFPHRLADDTEEERRLFHVAITRASGAVTVVTGHRPSPFVAELSTEPPAVLPFEPERPSRRSAPPARAEITDPLVDRNTVVVGAGMVLVDGGREWLVESVDDDGAMARQGEAVRRFAAGSKITTSGRQRGTLTVATEGEASAGQAGAVFDALRVIRERLRNGKPAYVVFDDKTLAAIARSFPETLDELAAVKGVGPAKLEQYGDDVLGVVAEAAARAGDSGWSGGDAGEGEAGDQVDPAASHVDHLEAESAPE